MLSIPPRRLAASLQFSRNGAVATSRCRFRLRRVHSGECACSVSDSWVTTPRTASMAAVPADGMDAGSASRLAHLLDDADRQPQPAHQEVAQRLGARRRRRTADRAVVAAVDGFGPSGVALEVEVLQGHLHATDAVGDGVVHLLHERRLAATEPLDDGELPQRAGAVEQVDHGQRRQIEQLAQAPRLGQGDPPHVVVDLEVRIVDPQGRRQVGRGRLHTPPEPRHRSDRPFHPRPEPVEVRRTIEHRDVPERRRQVRVLLEAPHQPFGVAHPPFVGVGHRSSISHGTYRRCPVRITRTWTNC